jgi:hypothetical protein
MIAGHLELEWAARHGQQQPVHPVPLSVAIPDKLAGRALQFKTVQS